MESIVCKNCLPEEYHHKAKQLRGFWEIDGNIARCSNCGFERPFVQRKRQVDKITPSQQKSIDRIKRFFEKRKESIDLYEFKVELSEYGNVWVSVQDVDNPLICRGGHFSIGRRGAITVNNSYEWEIDRKNEVMKHYAFMLNGKVSKY